MLSEERASAEEEAVAELARACGYLPLALRVAAANLIDRGGSRIADYLPALSVANRLGALAIDDDESAAVRAVLELSYLDLPVDAQRLFRLLGVIPGPDFTPGVAAALGRHPLSEASRLLQVLASASMLKEPAPGRYAFHDLLRDHAREQATGDPADRQAAVERMLRWYRDTANTADRVLRPTERPNFTSVDHPVHFTDRTEALAWLDAESPNLIAAVDSFADVHPRYSWQIAAALYGWLMRRYHRRRWADLYQVAVSAAARAGDTDGEAMLTGRLAIALSLLGVAAEAVAACRRAYELRRDHGDVLGAATALLNLAAVHINAGEPDEAIHWLSEVDRMRARLPNASYLATLVQTNLGEAHHLAGRHRRALDHYRHALRLAESADSVREAAQILVGMGVSYRAMGHWAEALAHFQRGLNLAQQQGDLDLRDEAYEGLGRLRAACGDTVEATTYLHKALNGYERRGHRNTESTRALLADLS